MQDGRLNLEDVTVVVWAFSADDAARFAERLPLHCITDVQGELSRACQVRSTPTVFIVSTEGESYSVIDYSPEGSIEWVLDQMTADQARSAQVA